MRGHGCTGLGLGLATSRRLMQLLGGTLDVTPAPGRGSTFWFQLTLPDTAGWEAVNGRRHARRTVGTGRRHAHLRAALVALHAHEHTSAFLFTSREAPTMAFYELRQYKVLPGKMDAFVRLMEEEIIPFQVSMGMVITGSYRGETDDSVYVWMRRFTSEAQRVALYAAVYESDTWKNSIAPRVPEMLDLSGIVVTRIVPTERSVAQ